MMLILINLLKKDRTFPWMFSELFYFFMFSFWAVFHPSFVAAPLPPDDGPPLGQADSMRLAREPEDPKARQGTGARHGIGENDDVAGVPAAVRALAVLFHAAQRLGELHHPHNPAV